MMRHVLPALLILAACSGSPSLEVPDGGSRADECYVPPDGGIFLTGLTAPVPGCAAPGPSGTFDLAVLGWAREGGVLVVPDAPPGTALPVVFGFHGAYAGGEEIREELALEGPADGGAILIYPNAVQGTWDIGPRSRDANLVDRLIRALSQNYCIDPERVSIAGYSAGAVFTLFLGCNVPGPFHAMASVAGTDLRFSRQCCTGSIAGIFIHGTRDEAIPISQGESARASTLARDGCTSTATPVDGFCEAYSCPAPWSVNWCEWGGDHAVPSFAGEEIWRFVSSP